MEPVGAREFVVPSILLLDSKTYDMARDCAVTANQFIRKSTGNDTWSVVFGVLQVAGASAGTVATSVAFAEGKTASTPGKIGAIGFATAAAFAAFDKAYSPGDRSLNESRVALKIGQLLLNAAALEARGDSDGARSTLLACQDPSYADVFMKQVDLSQLQEMYARLLASAGGKGGAGLPGPGEGDGSIGGQGGGRAAGGARGF